MGQPKEGTRGYSKEDLTEMINLLIDNVYATCGDSLHRQIIGIPMGTDCAPFLANLFLFSYEREWMMKKKKSDPKLAHFFSLTTRYIDDLLTINNHGLLLKCMREIYPKELVLKLENSDSDQQASYFDLDISIVDKELVTTLYDKRDDFPFKIVNFPDLSGNIPIAASYGVFIAQALRYARACRKYSDFLSRTRTLMNQLVRQHFLMKTLNRKLVTWYNTSTRGKTSDKYGHSIDSIVSDLKSTKDPTSTTA